MIEVRSVFDSSITAPLIRFQLRKLRIFMWLFPLFLVLVGVLIVVLEGSEGTVGVTMIICGVLYYPCVYFLSKFMQKSVNKSLKIMNTETTNNFTFTENRVFQETALGTDYRAVVEQSYSMYHKAFETQSHFFLYISNMQTHVIPKKDIVVGTAAELAALLSAHLGKNYKFVNTK